MAFAYVAVCPYILLLFMWLYCSTLPVPASAQPLNISDTQNVDTSKESQSSDNAWESGVRHRFKEKSNIILSGGPTMWYPGDSILPSDDGKGPQCRRKAKCERLNNTICLGVKLPYSSTSLDLVGMTQEQVQEKLQFWMALKHVPRCWAVIQPFLCALYMPRCENDKVDLPSQEMCKMALSPCRILELERGWTSPLRCEDTSRFPPMCKNDVREIRFNTTAQCLPPLVPTDNPSSFYEGVEGCGLQCANPMFTPDEHRQIQGVIAGMGGTCLFLNLFAVVSFLIDWHSASKYPPVAIFYINCCFLVVCVAFLAQFLPGAREGIVCKKDGTLRTSEPSGENLSCVVVFVLVYYSLMAACVWFVIFTYSWLLTLQGIGKIQERVDKKGAYFHLVAWSLPVVLTIPTIALQEVYGNSEIGICFVGYMDPTARSILLLGPTTAFYIAGSIFLVRGLWTLIMINIRSPEFINKRALVKIRVNIWKMAVIFLFSFVFFLSNFSIHINEFLHRRSWRESFRTYVMCKIMRSGGVLTDGVGLTGHGDCRMEVRPSLSSVQFHLLVLFGTGILMSALVWTSSSTFRTWTRFLKKLFNQDSDEPIKMKKYKVIAQVFAKRQVFNRAGRISISFHNTHDDPVGLNLELNSAASQDISSLWVAALPTLLTRRGALIDPATGSISSLYRNSFDSDISCGLQKTSVDSQHSLALREYTVGRTSSSTPVPPQASWGRVSGRVKPRLKRKKPHTKKSHFGRRSSTTSQDSQFGAQILSTLAAGNPNIASFHPNLKRRTGNAGLNDNQLPLAHAAVFRACDPTDDEEGTLIHSDALPNTVVTQDLPSDDQEGFEETWQPSKEAKQIIRCKTDFQSRVSKENEESIDQEMESFGNRKQSIKMIDPAGQAMRRVSEVNCNRDIENSVCCEENELKSLPTNDKFKDEFELLTGKGSKKYESSVLRPEKTTNQGKGYHIISDNSSHEDESDQSVDESEQAPTLKDKLAHWKVLSNAERENVEIKRKSNSGSLNSDCVRENNCRIGSGDSPFSEQECIAGPSSKSVTVSTLKHAREVGTQTSIPSDINNIHLIDNPRPKSINASTQLNNRSTQVEFNLST